MSDRTTENPPDEIVEKDKTPDLFYDPGPRRTFSIPLPETGRGKAFAIIAAVIAGIIFLPLSSRLSGVARVEAENSVAVEALVSGELSELYVKEGDRVKKGDKLGLIFDRVTGIDLVRELDQKAILEKRLKIASDRAEFLKKKNEKNEKLFQSDAVTASDKDAAEFEYHQALQEVTIAETELNTAVSRISYLEKIREIGLIRSPIDGVILSNVSRLPTTYFAKGDPILEIADMETIVLELPVQETQLRRIREGQRVDLRFYAYPERKFGGHVKGIHPSAYEKTEKVWVKENVVNVLIKLDKPPSFPVRAGMTAKVQVHCKFESLFGRLRSKFL